MDHLPVEIKIDHYWNTQLHALLIFKLKPHQSGFAFYRRSYGRLVYYTKYVILFK